MDWAWDWEKGLIRVRELGLGLDWNWPENAAWWLLIAPWSSSLLVRIHLFFTLCMSLSMPIRVS
jgi:hypothetical protein